MDLSTPSVCFNTTKKTNTFTEQNQLRFRMEFRGQFFQKENIEFA